MELFEQIRKIHEREGLSKRELARRFKTHRRNVRQADFLDDEHHAALSLDVTRLGPGGEIRLEVAVNPPRRRRVHQRTRRRKGHRRASLTGSWHVPRERDFPAGILTVPRDGFGEPATACHMLTVMAQTRSGTRKSGRQALHDGLHQDPELEDDEEAPLERADGRRLGAPSGKGRKFPAEILTADEVKALVRACSTRGPHRGPQPGPARGPLPGRPPGRRGLALLPKNLDPRRGTIRVLHGKGDTARTVGLDPEALAVVERWTDLRRTLSISSRRRLFCTLAGGPIDPSYVRQLLPRLAGRAGIDKRMHAHGLRHTHAAELAEEGYPVNFIQDQLGHASLAVTDRYLRHIALPPASKPSSVDTGGFTDDAQGNLMVDRHRFP